MQHFKSLFKNEIISLISEHLKENSSICIEPHEIRIVYQNISSCRTGTSLHFEFQHPKKAKNFEDQI